MFFVFFFKQKTAYEMRISDWSSTCALPISALVQAFVLHQCGVPGGDRRSLPVGFGRGDENGVGGHARISSCLSERIAAGAGAAGREAPFRAAMSARARTRSRSEAHQSELQSLIHMPDDVFCLQTKKHRINKQFHMY